MFFHFLSARTKLNLKRPFQMNMDPSSPRTVSSCWPLGYPRLDRAKSRTSAPSQEGFGTKTKPWKVQKEVTVIPSNLLFGSEKATYCPYCGRVLSGNSHSLFTLSYIPMRGWYVNLEAKRTCLNAQTEIVTSISSGLPTY